MFTQACLATAPAPRLRQWLAHGAHLDLDDAGAGRLRAGEHHTAAATSSGASIADCATLSAVRPLPSADAGLTPPGQITPILMPWGRSSRSSACAKPTWANLLAQYTASPAKP